MWLAIRLLPAVTSETCVSGQYSSIAISFHKALRDGCRSHCGGRGELCSRYWRPSGREWRGTMIGFDTRYLDSESRMSFQTERYHRYHYEEDRRTGNYLREEKQCLISRSGFHYAIGSMSVGRPYLGPS